MAVGDPVLIERANQKPYGPLSVYHMRDMTFEGATYASAEHAFQAGKPKREEVRRWLMAAPSTALLTMAAQGLPSWEIRSGWSRTVRDRMRRVIAGKFAQHTDLRDLLERTGPARIVFAPGVDNAMNRVWGEIDGEGENVIGRILMAIRDDI